MLCRHARLLRPPTEFGRPRAPEPLFPRRPRRRWPLIGVAVLLATLVGGDGLTASPAATTTSQFSLIEEAWVLLHEKYAEPRDLDSREMAYAAIRAMTEAVGDPGHTTFATAAEAREAEAIPDGTYGGIGVTLDERGVLPVIVEVERGGPADIAGLRVGDRIVGVDGIPITSPADAWVLFGLYGAPGSAVDVTIARIADRRRTVRIIRAAVPFSAVSAVMLPDSRIGFVDLLEFNTGCADKLANAVAGLETRGAKGLILDLRSNTGGSYEEALGVVAIFQASGYAVVERTRSRELRAVPVPERSPRSELPLAILVNEYTASSSEIVAAALQDSDRAVIIGTRTAGTGTIVEAWELEDGSYLWIGTMRWLSPKGRDFRNLGIRPDVEVDLGFDEWPIWVDDIERSGAKGELDSQLAAAVEALEQELR